MNTVPYPRIFINRRRIASAVARIGAEIRRDYREKNPLLIGILKGSFIFVADLVRKLDFPLEVEFIQLSSYGNSTRSSGQVTLLTDPCPDVSGRHVLIVEDIIDTGLTSRFLYQYFLERGAVSIKLCALLDKPSRRKESMAIDYLGFTVPDMFLVGYGLDYCEKYRNLPDLCILENETKVFPQ